MKWAFRSLVALGAIACILDSNWAACIWIAVALMQHERAEMIRGWR